jgi:hypothetical protein
MRSTTECREGNDEFPNPVTCPNCQAQIFWQKAPTPEAASELVDQLFAKYQVPRTKGEFNVQLDKAQRRLDFLQQVVKDIDASVQDLQLSLDHLWSELAKPDEDNKAPSPFRESDPELSRPELAQALLRIPMKPPEYDPDMIFYKDRGSIAPAEDPRNPQTPEPTTKMTVISGSQLFDILTKLAPPPEKMRKAGK